MTRSSIDGDHSCGFRPGSSGICRVARGGSGGCRALTNESGRPGIDQTGPHTIRTIGIFGVSTNRILPAISRFFVVVAGRGIQPVRFEIVPCSFTLWFRVALGRRTLFEGVRQPRPTEPWGCGPLSMGWSTPDPCGPRTTSVGEQRHVPGVQTLVSQSVISRIL